MFGERALKLATRHAKRKLSRQRPVVVIAEYACLAFVITLISYLITFNLIIYPLASFMFKVTGRISAVHMPRSSGDPAGKSYFSTGASTANGTKEQRLRNKHINYANIPMRRPEADLMLAYLKKTDVYLEFGSSGTSLAFPFLVNQSFTIEHEVRVCEHIGSKMKKSKKLGAKLRAFCAPVAIGHAGWGLVSKFEEGSYKAFRNYVDFPRSNLSDIIFDKVLINGRARVACALRILPQLTSDSVVFFHDYFIQPAHYSAILPFYDELARVVLHGPVRGYTDDPMGLLVLRPKADYVGDAAEISLSRINAVYEHYVEKAPTEKSTTLDVAFQNGLLPTNKGGVPYYELIRQQSYETTVMRIILDLIIVPCIVLTYLVLEGVFRHVFLDVLSASNSRSARLLAGDMRAVSLWPLRAPSQVTSSANKLLPTTNANIRPSAGEQPVTKAE